MALQGRMSYDHGKTHNRVSSIHQKRASLDENQLGQGHIPHVVGVKSPIHKFPERLRPNHTSEDEQRRKSVWDCESSLYDSFELYTFSRQLNRAIAAASTSSSLIENNQLIGGVRSWSMPHHVSTKSSREWQYSPVNVNLQEEQLRPDVVQGNTHQITIHADSHQRIAQNEVERQQGKRSQNQQTQNKGLGFPRSVQRLFTRLFHKKAGIFKPKNTMEAGGDDRYCYNKSVHPEQQKERYSHHSRGLSVHSSEFDPKVRKTASERISHQRLGSLIRRESTVHVLC